MASIPMGAFASMKVRDQQKQQQEEKNSYYGMNLKMSANNMEAHEHPPAKYNSKLMNSIWGQYNRFSVHNIKSHIAFDKA